MDHWPEELIDALAEASETSPHGDGSRRIIAIAGGPAAGKSTLAQALAARLNRDAEIAQVLPMDGFHMRAADLARLGMTHLKGAPETFDVEGFANILARVRGGAELLAPSYSRVLHDVVDEDIAFRAQHTFAITEGNYLLLNRPEWRRLRSFFNCSIFIESDEAVVRERLKARHEKGGMAPDKIADKIEGVDLMNRLLVAGGAEVADFVITTGAELRASKRA